MRGGAGSGKSYSIAQKVLLECLQDSKTKYLILRKTKTSVRDSVFSLLKSLISQYNLSAYFKINKTEMSFTCVNGAQIITSGLDDVEKLKSIHGVTKAWIEEASEITEDEFKQVNLRLRGVGIKHQIILSFNPVDEMSWLKSYFYDIPKENALLHLSTYQHNRFLDDEYKQELENLINVDQYFYDVYVTGKWGNISNAKVFNNVIVEDFDYTPDNLQNVRYGQDYGFNHASTLMGAGYRDGELYIFLEHFYKGHTNKEFIEKVDESKFPKNQIIIGDSAEPDRIKEWNQFGYKVKPSKKGKGSLKNGIDYLRGLPKIHIHKTNCPNSAKEFLSFKHRELKDGTITEDFVELNDDTIAGVRYLSEEFWQYKKNVTVPEFHLPV